MAAGGLRNWAGNVRFTARELHRPGSVAQLRELVARAERVRALGTGHSFSPIADSPGALVTVAGLPPTVTIDAAAGTASVPAGMRYGELVATLQSAGYGLPALASLPHISVGGACATGTHGSGDRVGNLATAVTGLELVTAGGELVRLRRDADPDRFAGAVVALGGLGIVTRLTLRLVPGYEVRQHVYEGLPLVELAAHFDEVFSAAYSVSVFTRWDDPPVAQVWLKQRLPPADPPPDPPARFGRSPLEQRPPASPPAGPPPLAGGRPPARWWGARLAGGPRHPVPGMPPEHCTDQLGVPGPWHLRLPHFRLDFTPSSGQELQSEYFVPRSAAGAALAAVARLGERIAPVLQVSEIRTVAADDLWLSPCYRRDSVAFHFTWIADQAAVDPVVVAVEEALTAAVAPSPVRPHWGKLFHLPPAAVRAGYPRLPDFVALARELDPAGTFSNPMLDRYLLS